MKNYTDGKKMSNKKNLQSNPIILGENVMLTFTSNTKLIKKPVQMTSFDYHFKLTFDQINSTFSWLYEILMRGMEECANLGNTHSQKLRELYGNIYI